MCMGGSAGTSSTVSVPVTSTPTPVIPQSPASTGAASNTVAANNTSGNGGQASTAATTGTGLNIPGG